MAGEPGGRRTWFKGRRKPKKSEMEEHKVDRRCKRVKRRRNSEARGDFRPSQFLPALCSGV